MRYLRRWPWVGQQEWRDVLFMHWAVPYDLLKPFIPEPFVLETYNKKAWISIVIFRAEKSRLRGMPHVMSYPSFLQMNIRTYIHFDGEPGIYFLSVDVNRLLAMIAATKVIQLPYEIAEMSMEQVNDQYLFESKRIKNNSNVHISASFRRLKNMVNNKETTLTHWLTERYCFWMIYGNSIVKGPISHKPWALSSVELDSIKIHLHPPTVLHEYLQSSPLIYYAPSMHAYLHPFERKGIYKRS